MAFDLTELPSFAANYKHKEGRTGAIDFGYLVDASGLNDAGHELHASEGRAVLPEDGAGCGAEGLRA
jgi:hypothetical protein